MFKDKNGQFSAGKLCLCCVNNAVEVFIKTELCKKLSVKAVDNKSDICFSH